MWMERGARTDALLEPRAYCCNTGVRTDHRLRDIYILICARVYTSSMTHFLGLEF